MANRGVTLLREIAMVKASSVEDHIKAAMLKQLNDELQTIYGTTPQGSLELSAREGPGDATKTVAATKGR